MAKPVAATKPAAAKAVPPKARLGYVNQRLEELRLERERLVAERASLRQMIAAERAKA